MAFEKRRHARFTVVDLELYFQDPQERIGQIVNLSEGGLLVVAGEPVEPYSIHKFRILFNQTIQGEIKFDFEASVVWSNPNSLDPSKHSIGLQFVENPELQTKFIRQMIKVFGK